MKKYLIVRRTICKDKFVPVLATPDNISISVPRMASGVRHRHDNLSADILKMMLRFSSRRGAEPIVEEFLNLYATFLNNVFMQLVYPKQLTKLFDGGKIFGLSTAKKSKSTDYNRFNSSKTSRQNYSSIYTRKNISCLKWCAILSRMRFWARKIGSLCPLGSQNFSRARLC